ncbi:MAG: DUF1343 domain-containing protein [Candidatus Eremiobacteraeota bacterium]|nr:DUF1343 domain-containing protein [Candidatus Eremiobacteraeota bacterium]
MRGLSAVFVCWLVLAAAASAGPLPPARITLGDEVFLAQTWHDLGKRCVGVVTNQTGVTSAQESIVDAIRSNPKICIKAIFAPEHGLRGDRPAGSYVASYKDGRTGLPVYSLYGPTRRPTAAMLRNVDVLLYDIQDVGARTYTYISTLAYVMQAAAAAHKEVWVLDRPNPTGGMKVEGPVLDRRFSSFIGLYPIAMRHGMTVGELAQMFNEAFGIRAKLRVVEMRDWLRSMLWPETGLFWVQSSPNIPDWSTTVLYPCTGLIDHAGLNNATGSAKPFAYAGTLGLNADAYADNLNAFTLPGVYFRPAAWSPFAGFWAGKTLTGVELVVYNPRIFAPVKTAVELLTVARRLQPSSISIRSAHALDTDWGTDSLRRGLLAGESADQIVAGWQRDLDAFQKLRARYLLYGD